MWNGSIKGSVAAVFAVGALASAAPASAQVVVSQPAPPTTQVVTSPPAAPPQVIVNNPTPAPQQPPAVVVAPTESRPVVYEGRRRDGLIGGGIALFAVPYLTTVIAAAVTSDVCNADSSLGCREAKWPIYIPVIGPFVQMGYISGNGSNTAKALLAIDGTLQAGGIAMLIAGIALRASGKNDGLQARRIQFLPAALGSGSGLVAMGRF